MSSTVSLGKANGRSSVPYSIYLWLIRFQKASV